MCFYYGNKFIHIIHIVQIVIKTERQVNIKIVENTLFSHGGFPYLIIIFYMNLHNFQ